MLQCGASTSWCLCSSEVVSPLQMPWPHLYFLMMVDPHVPWLPCVLLYIQIASTSFWTFFCCLSHKFSACLPDRHPVIWKVLIMHLVPHDSINLHIIFSLARRTPIPILCHLALLSQWLIAFKGHLHHTWNNLSAIWSYSDYIIRFSVISTNSITPAGINIL